MSKAGNTAFMVTISAGAVLSTVGVALLGFSTVSLAIVILSLFVSIPLGLFLEKKFDAREVRQNKQLMDQLISQTKIRNPDDKR